MSFNIAGNLASHLSIGTVELVYPSSFTALVQMTVGRSRGQTLECRIRSLAHNDTARSGVIFLPEIGDQVYVDWDFGTPPIIVDGASVPMPSEAPKGYKAKILPVRGFGGEELPSLSSGTQQFRWGPTDAMPGDKIISGSEGNFLGVLAGGLSVLRGGPLSQLILSKVDDWAKLIAKNFEVFSGFGKLSMTTLQGKSIFELLGYSRDVMANKHFESGYEYIFRLGGNNLLELLLGKDKFQFIVNPDGNAFVKAAGGFKIEMDRPPEILVKGSQVTNVEGDKVDAVDGNRAQLTTGLVTEKVGRKNFIASGAVTSTFGASETKMVFGPYSETIRGTAITSLDTIGRETIIAAGDYKVSVGMPQYLGTPSVPLLAQVSMGGVEFEVFSGNFMCNILTKGNYSFFTTAGNIAANTLLGSIQLGSTLGATITAGTSVLSMDLTGISATAAVGDISLTTAAGGISLMSPLGGVTIQGGPVSKIEMTPLGTKITSNGVELIALLQQLTQALSTDATPGYGSPLVQAPNYGLMAAQLQTFLGA